jgi:hypothetical protein
MPSWIPLATSVLLSILGGGLLGTWLTHVRLGPKSKAEARDITAAAIDKDWTRFQREIGRLVKRVEHAEDAAKKALEGQRDCEEREVRLRGRVIELETVLQARGEMRQRAALIVAAEKLGEAQ